MRFKCKNKQLAQRSENAADIYFCGQVPMLLMVAMFSTSNIQSICPAPPSKWHGEQNPGKGTTDQTAMTRTTSIYIQQFCPVTRLSHQSSPGMMYTQHLYKDISVLSTVPTFTSSRTRPSPNRQQKPFTKIFTTIASDQCLGLCTAAELRQHCLLEHH